MKDERELSRRIIVALDETGAGSIDRIVRATTPFIQLYKVGSIAFTALGPKLIEDLAGKGKEVFLDLKYFDIPNTVYKAVRQAVSCGVKMITLHALGGREMLGRAVEANGGKAILLGVTLLTSMDTRQLREMGLGDDTQAFVGLLAQTAVSAGLNGLVASGQETAKLRNQFGRDITIVVPGVRLPDRSAPADDQKRVVTPKVAFDAGADYIVMGRPVTESRDPAAVIEAIIKNVKEEQ